MLEQQPTTIEKNVDEVYPKNYSCLQLWKFDSVLVIYFNFFFSLTTLAPTIYYKSLILLRTGIERAVSAILKIFISILTF